MTSTVKLPVSYLVSSRIPEFFREAEIDRVNEVALLAEAHQEIVRLDVAVDEVFAVDELDAADLVDGDQNAELVIWVLNHKDSIIATHYLKFPR